MRNLAFTSAAGLAGMVARRAVSPVELVDRVLGRIERSQPVLNAFITVCADEARAAAKAAEAAVLRGDALGSLLRAAALFEAARPWAERRPKVPGL